MGPIITNQTIHKSVSCHAVHLEEFFEVESIPQQTDKLHNEVENFFKEITKRTQTGRYVVIMPFIGNFQLGDSSNQALKSFMHMNENNTAPNRYRKSSSHQATSKKTTIRQGLR